MSCTGLWLSFENARNPPKSNNFGRFRELLSFEYARNPSKSANFECLIPGTSDDLSLPPLSTLRAARETQQELYVCEPRLVGSTPVLENNLGSLSPRHTVSLLLSISRPPPTHGFTSSILTSCKKISKNIQKTENIYFCEIF